MLNLLWSLALTSNQPTSNICLHSNQSGYHMFGLPWPRLNLLVQFQLREIVPLVLPGTCSLLPYWYIGPLGLNPDRICRSNGLLFNEKSLNMGPILYQTILKHGSNFLTELKFSGFGMAKTPKMAKFVKNWPIFQGKSIAMGTVSAEMTLKDR